MKTAIQNRKGQKIAAIVEYSTPKTDKLAILCPGYLDTKDYDHLVKLSEVLVGRGYTVVRFDPTGTWGSEGSVSNYLTSEYLEDIKSILEYMLHEGNYLHVLLGGHSRGGMVSILYAARDQRISTVLGIMPSSGSSMGKRREEWERNGFSVSQRDIPVSKEKQEFKVPFSHVLDRDKFDVVGDVKKIHSPAIFIAGELDNMVLPEDVKEIYDNANEPKKFILMKGIGHNYRRHPSEIELVNNEILKALEALS